MRQLDVDIHRQRQLRARNPLDICLEHPWCWLWGEWIRCQAPLTNLSDVIVHAEFPKSIWIASVNFVEMNLVAAALGISRATLGPILLITVGTRDAQPPPPTYHTSPNLTRGFVGLLRPRRFSLGWNANGLARLYWQHLIPLLYPHSTALAICGDSRLRAFGDITEYAHPTLASGGGSSGFGFHRVPIDEDLTLVPSRPEETRSLELPAMQGSLRCDSGRWGNVYSGAPSRRAVTETMWGGIRWILRSFLIDNSCFVPSRSTTAYSEARGYDRGSLDTLAWHLGTISSTRVTDEHDSNTHRPRYYAGETPTRGTEESIRVLVHKRIFLMSAGLGWTNVLYSAVTYLDGLCKLLLQAPGSGTLASCAIRPPTRQSIRRFTSHAPAIPSIDAKPAAQNTLRLNTSALRYALQLPLLGRAKQQVPDLQGRIGERPGRSHEGEPSGSQATVRSTDVNDRERASAPKAGTIVARYSDEHDFVIIEIEVDGWILINTEGGSPVSPLGPTPAVGRTVAGGNSWWDYYVGGANPGSTSMNEAPGREDRAGPAAKMAGGLSSPAKGTEAARDSDTRSVASSVFSSVLRPFGRSKDAKVSEESPALAPIAPEDTQQASRPAKTQAELIKEEALARQSPSVVPALPGPVLNSATKSSWVSYFSSNASRSAPAMSDGRAVKQRAENATDMEVMDIDEEELSQPVEVHVPSPPISSPTSRTGGTSATGKPASPLTDSPSVKHKASIISQGKKSSASSTKSTKVSFPNLVLPTFGDTFYTVPRCVPPHIATTSPSASTIAPAPGPWKLKRTVKNLSTLLFNTNAADKSSGPYVPNAEMEEYQHQLRERRRLTNRANFAVVEPAVPRLPNASRASTIRPGNVRSTSSFGSLAIDDFGNELPRVFSVLGEGNAFGDIAGPMRAVVIGVHGWFPGAIVRSVFGEPTGTSIKFATMGVDAMRQFAEKHGLNLESVIPMPLEGEGTIERRVIKLYDDLLKHPQWLADLHRADVVLVATHSQGSIVSTHLIARLISDGHIRTKSNRDAVNRATENTGVLPPIAPHRVCCLAMCGIHMGPLYSLNSSSLAQPYLQWFESQAARELFEFQDTDSEVSRNYVAALSTALDHGTKFVYVASLNDQVVPIYSGTFVAASHPLILRGLFLDGDAYSSSDFLSNLLILLLRVKNAGLDEQGLVIHLSEATAGSLSGIGHSTAYEDLGPYSLAVRYLFETSDLAPDNDCKLKVEAFQARASRNDYEIPWLLHTLITDTRIGRIFSPELSELRDSFADWKPVTAILRDVQRKLAPIRSSRLRQSTTAEDTESKVVNSKLYILDPTRMDERRSYMPRLGVLSGPESAMCERAPRQDDSTEPSQTSWLPNPHTPIIAFARLVQYPPLPV
ncbi:hypothetical protein BDV93DRAFT_507709 [Ceratobasidium sp. AG-I]|nr:hypothetical protein BDV93DRAFT_507709 [Ceratobasidium sp. AG-I]